MLPFTRDQFLQVFADYNLAIFPMQVLAYVVGLLVLVGFFQKGWDRLVATVLAGMWLWTGVVYHMMFFATINAAAYGFGGLFVVQGLLLLFAGWSGQPLRFGVRPGPVGWIGWALMIYAIAIYPVIGLLSGHGYPALPMFGVTPCPVTIFTFGAMLLTTNRVAWWLLVIPVLWSLIGGSAAALLGVAQDWPLLVSGLVTLGLLRAFPAAERPRPA